MSILQLDPPLPVHVLGIGSCLAYFLRDYGPEHDDYWTVVTPDGEFWTVNNKLVRAQENVTLGRKPERESGGASTARPAA